MCHKPEHHKKNGYSSFPSLNTQVILIMYGIILYINRINIRIYINRIK